MSEALMVIDCQEGLFSDPDYPVFNQQKLFENINMLIRKFKENNQPVIFVRHTDEDLTQGSTEWQISAQINTTPQDIYVNKSTPDSFYETDLLTILNSKNINSIVIVGLQADYCIDATCKSAFGKNIDVTLISDAHSTYDNSFMKADKTIEYHNKIIGRWFGTLRTTQEYCNN